MIYVKWSIDWFQYLDKNNFHTAPSIISMLMNIFLKLGDVGDTPLWGGAGVQKSFHQLVLCMYLVI
jgi:hypothetical protein